MVVITSERSQSWIVEKYQERSCHNIEKNNGIEGIKLQKLWDWHRKLIGLVCRQEGLVKWVSGTGIFKKKKVKKSLKCLFNLLWKIKRGWRTPQYLKAWNSWINVWLPSFTILIGMFELISQFQLSPISIKEQQKAF